MSAYKFIISFVWIVFCVVPCNAQKADNYEFEDSSILSKQAEAPIESANTQNSYKGLVDTMLWNNQLVIQADSVEVLKNVKAFGYAKNLDSLLKEWQKKNQIKINSRPDRFGWLDSFFGSPVTKIIFFLLAGIFIGFILYKLFFTEGFFQRQRARSNVVALAPQEELNNGTDYNKLIAQAIGNKNYRLGVRYLYLQTLQKLMIVGLIQFATDKTNYQYLRELESKPCKNEFVLLTISYEYIWYGEFSIDETQFSRIQNDFKQFNNKL